MMLRASCGCTTPSWTKDPVSPGETGSIVAEYNPLNRPGSFSKPYLLRPMQNPIWIVLHIKTVHWNQKTLEDDYPLLGSFAYLLSLI